MSASAPLPLRADRRLIVAIHDVGPAFAEPIRMLADRIEALIGAPRFAMLVVPDHWGMAPLGAHPGFRASLRSWADAGVEMFLHGWQHRDETRHQRLLDRFRASTMTAREGEFLGLTAAEAGRRMREGRDVVEQATGRPVAGFVAPAWLYGAGARSAMREVGFALAEDHFRVWRPANDEVLARGPVVTWASRSRARTASSLAVAAIARSSFGRMPTVRVAVHPGDVTKPALLASIGRTIRILAQDRAVSRYAELLQPKEDTAR